MTLEEMKRRVDKAGKISYQIQLLQSFILGREVMQISYRDGEDSVHHFPVNKTSVNRCFNDSSVTKLLFDHAKTAIASLEQDLKDLENLELPAAQASKKEIDVADIRGMVPSLGTCMETPFSKETQYYWVLESSNWKLLHRSVIDDAARSIPAPLLSELLQELPRFFITDAGAVYTLGIYTHYEHREIPEMRPCFYASYTARIDNNHYEYLPYKDKSLSEVLMFIWKYASKLKCNAELLPGLPEDTGLKIVAIEY